MGVIYKLDLEDGCSRYELAHDDEEHRHHHLVCNKCGKVFEVEADLLDELEEEIETKYGFEILDHTVKFSEYARIVKWIEKFSQMRKPLLYISVLLQKEEGKYETWKAKG